MKPNQLIGLAAFLLVAERAEAQIRVNDPKQTTERHVEGRVNSRIDQGINRGLDKVEQGIGTIFKKKEKTNKNEKPQSGASEAGEAEEEPETARNAKPAKTGSGATPAAGSASLKSYSKYDFVPGEKVVAYEDFAQDAVGDFPDKWNTNASGEVVTIEGKTGKWLKISQNGGVSGVSRGFTRKHDD